MAPSLTTDHYVNNPCMLYVQLYYDADEVLVIDGGNPIRTIPFKSMAANEPCPNGETLSTERVQAAIPADFGVRFTNYFELNAIRPTLLDDAAATISEAYEIVLDKSLIPEKETDQLENVVVYFSSNSSFYEGGEHFKHKKQFLPIPYVIPYSYCEDILTMPQLAALDSSFLIGSTNIISLDGIDNQDCAYELSIESKSTTDGITPPVVTLQQPEFSLVEERSSYEDYDKVSQS